MTGPISHNHLVESLKEAASWPGADRNAVMILALTLVSAGADAEGSSYFQDSGIPTAASWLSSATRCSCS